MYQRYTEYCAENDRQAHGKSTFFRMIKEKGYFVKRNNQGYYFDNLSFVDESFFEIDKNDLVKIPFEQIKLMPK